MTWTATSGIQVQNLLTQIGTDLTGTGWTLHDGGANNVYKSTNDQGVTQYVQITQVGSYQYLQFQGWQSWNAGTHAGTNGSGTTTNRLYFAASAVGATTTVDLYTSVTANRFIIFIQGIGNYRNWAYFGGLDSLAGTNDPFCVYLIAAHGATSSTAAVGMILQPSPGGSFWQSTGTAIPAFVSSNASNSLTNSVAFTAQPLGPDTSQTLIFPILIADYNSSAFLCTTIRGNLDGLLFCPLGSGYIAHLDTVSVGGTTYLIIQPGGETAANSHPITGSYNQGLAIVES